MRKIFFLFLSFLCLASCYKYSNSFFESNEKWDQAIDYLGDGKYVQSVMLDKKIAWGTLAKQGKTKAEILDFLGYSLEGGIIYFIVDSREYDGKLPDNVVAEIQQFRKDWKDGKYIMSGRKLNDVWLVYGENEQDMMTLNGYYKGKGWYLYTLENNKDKFIDTADKLEDVVLGKYIQSLVDRTIKRPIKL